jgi:hypothetical protein
MVEIAAMCIYVVGVLRIKSITIKSLFAKKPGKLPGNPSKGNRWIRRLCSPLIQASKIQKSPHCWRPGVDQDRLN